MDAPHFACRPFPGPVRRRRGHCLRQRTARCVAAGDRRRSDDAAFAWLVLRYDLRAVPAFVATGLILDGAKTAAVAATAQAWILLAPAALVPIALAWWVTRYVTAPLPERPR